MILSNKQISESKAMRASARNIAYQTHFHMFARLLVQLFGRRFVFIISCSSIFVRSFIRSFVCSIMRSFVRSFVHPFFGPFVHSFVPPFAHLFYSFPISAPGKIDSWCFRSIRNSIQNPFCLIARGFFLSLECLFDAPFE